MKRQLSYLTIVVFAFLFATSSYAGREQFSGTWSAVDSTPFSRIEIDRQFNVSVQGMGSGSLVSYGTGVGHPNSHISATTEIYRNGVTYRLFFVLGGILTSGRNPDVFDVMIFEDHAYNLDYGNVARRVRYERR
ncbi:MAG: hypothetical protein ACOH5I_09365 [Oligoflexus sp.]